jgi:hypothetical protein
VRAGDLLLAWPYEKLAIPLGLLMWLSIISKDARCTGEAVDEPGLKQLPEPAVGKLNKTSPRIYLPDGKRLVLLAIEATNIGNVAVAPALPAGVGNSADRAGWLEPVVGANSRGHVRYENVGPARDLMLCPYV